TGIAQDVRNKEDTLVEEDAVGLRTGRAVRRLGDDLRRDPRCVVLADLVLDRRGDEDVAVELEQLRVGYLLRPGEPRDGTGLALVRIHFQRIDALRVVDAAARVRESHDLRAKLRHELRGERAGVAEAL